jgi:hypothetical protein
VGGAKGGSEGGGIKGREERVAYVYHASHGAIPSVLDGTARATCVYVRVFVCVCVCVQTKGGSGVIAGIEWRPADSV